MPYVFYCGQYSLFEYVISWLGCSKEKGIIYFFVAVMNLKG